MAKVKTPKPITKDTAALPEPYAAGTSERPGCKACGLACGSITFARPFVPSGWTRELVVLRDHPAPPAAELELLTTQLRAAGFRAADVAYVPALRCAATNPTMQQLRACRPFLVYAIDKLAPKRVLALGGDALRAVTNDGRTETVVDHRSRPLPTPGTTHKPLAYATYAPSAVLGGGYALEARIREDLARLREPAVEHPERNTPAMVDTLAVDTEYAPDGTLLTVGISDGKTALACEGAEIPDVTTHIEQATTLVGHSVQGDLDHLARLGVAKSQWLRGYDVFDTVLVARMSDENRGAGGYTLENLLLSFANVAPWKAETEAYGVDATTWPVDARLTRCSLDAWAAMRLYTILREANLKHGPVRFTHRVAQTLHRVELAGLCIDRPVYDRLAAEYREIAARAKDLLEKTAAMHGMTGFAPTNDNDLRVLLYDKLGLKPGGKTDTGKLKVDKKTLKAHAEHEVVQLLTEFNRADKFYSTNFAGIESLIGWWDDERGGLPLNINPLGARTGRRSAHNPNCQNWPKEVRLMVRSRHATGLIGDHDYSRLEVVLMGWRANDPKLLDYFLNGDGYCGVAKELWGKDVEKDTPLYKAAKAIVLGIGFNKQYRSIARDMWAAGVHLDENYDKHELLAKGFRSTYLKKFPGVGRYIAWAQDKLLTRGVVYSPTGRARRLPLREGQADQEYWHAWNQAVNFPIQSMASDVTGSALIDVEAAILHEYKLSVVEYHQMLLEKKWPAIPIICNEVHDDLVVDYPNTDATRHKRDVELVVETMRALPSLREICPQFTVRPKVGVDIAPRWGMKSS